MLEFALIATDTKWLEGNWQAIDGTRFTTLNVIDHPYHPGPDPWTFLAYAAGKTSRIRLGTHVTGAPFRHPTALARAVTTVDVLSGGRASLGIGTAYERDDFEPFGFEQRSFGKRVSDLEETIQILKRLWTGDPSPYTGGSFRLGGGAKLEPRPVQSPHPPIIVGLNTPGKLARMAAAHAEGINTWQLGPDQVCSVREFVLEECERNGRDATQFRITADVLFPKVAGQDQAEAVANQISQMARSWGRDEKVTDWHAGGVLHGDQDAMVEQCLSFAEVGVTERTVSISTAEDATWFSENVAARASAAAEKVV